MNTIGKLGIVFAIAGAVYVFSARKPVEKVEKYGLDGKHAATLDSLVKSFEGCRLTAYPDAHGKPAIGWGHAGKEVRMGMTITQRQADSLLQADIQHAGNIVEKHVKTELTPLQKVATISMVFNIGTGSRYKDGFIQTKRGGPSRFLKLLNAGEMRAAANEMQKWRLGGGKVLKGLERRRQAERTIFLKGTRR
jgi:lysozyme